MRDFEHFVCMCVCVLVFATYIALKYTVYKVRTFENGNISTRPHNFKALCEGSDMILRLRLDMDLCLR